MKNKEKLFFLAVVTVSLFAVILSFLVSIYTLRSIYKINRDIADIKTILSTPVEVEWLGD